MLRFQFLVLEYKQKGVRQNTFRQKKHSKQTLRQKRTVGIRIYAPVLKKKNKNKRFEMGRVELFSIEKQLGKWFNTRDSVNKFRFEELAKHSNLVMKVVVILSLKCVKLFYLFFCQSFPPFKRQKFKWIFQFSSMKFEPLHHCLIYISSLIISLCLFSKFQQKSSPRLKPMTPNCWNFIFNWW